MMQDLTYANATLKELDELCRTGEVKEFHGDLRCGVDLGTANIVLAVVDDDNRPIAAASHPSKAVRDGVVVDYIGAVQAVRTLRARLEESLDKALDVAAAAIPPGVIEGSVNTIANVVEAADFHLTNIVDEPSAAARVLGIKNGAVVDVGGGTTGISILHDGKVTYVADEPTGGTHMTLVLAGALGVSTDEAEAIKLDPSRERDIYTLVRPTVEKMASITKRFIEDQNNPVDEVYVVGGACSFSEFEKTFEKFLSVPVIKPAVPLLVTPLGIAMECTKS